MLWAFKVARAGEIAFRLTEPRRTMETSYFTDACSAALLRLYHVSIAPCLKPSSCLLWWQPRCNSSRTSSASPFVTDTDGASVCVRFVPCFLSTYVGNRNEHMISRQGQLMGWCTDGAGRYFTHTSSGFEKQPRTPGTRYKKSRVATAVERHSPFKLWPFMTAAVLVCWYV